MHLINTSKFRREELHKIDGKAEYAILSHRWLDRNETTFNDYDEQRMISDESSPGLDKIRGACEAARDRFCEWIWIDNVCIDKSSSEELSESIRSMFKWYREAEICIVFLADTRSSVRQRSGEPSEWFSREWTLQELLAPRRMEFFDGNWQAFGSRRELVGDISAVSRIESCYLDGSKDFWTASIAMRLSWQASRTTKRAEDMAYSLLGVLTISLDARYGGGGHEAWMRLQEELIKHQRVSDESLFAWTAPEGTLPSHDRAGWNPNEWGLLAPSPACFLNSGDVYVATQFRERPHNGIGTTGDGVVFPMPRKEFGYLNLRWIPLLLPVVYVSFGAPLIIHEVLRKRRKFFTVSLNCWRIDRGDKKARPRPVQVHIARDRKGDQYWRRCHCDVLSLDRKMETGQMTRVSTPVTILQPNVLDR